MIQDQHGVNNYNVTLLTISWISLLADSPLDELRPNSVYNKFFTELTTDLKGTIARLSQLAHEVVSSLTRDSDGAISSTFVEGMKRTPIFRDYLTFHKTCDARTLRYVLSFLNFGKKLYYEDRELDTVAFHKWCQVEKRLSDLELPPMVKNLKRILFWIFDCWSDGPFLPKHGSGAVSEAGIRGINSKNLRFNIPEKIRYLYATDRLLADSNETGNFGLPGMNYENEGCQVLTSSRLKFVPKDYRTTRSICMEPIGFMWAQQGVRLWLEDYISKSILGNHVVLEDQGVNQRASAFGSKTGLVDTLDLSSASDSVSWDLVKAIFPAKILKHLAATRTRDVEVPSGQIVRVSKFAPMGSALCFPTQCLVYSAVILTVGICQYFGIDWKDPEALTGVDLERAYYMAFRRRLSEGRGALQPFFAYGDDLIVDNAISSSVIEALTMLGFDVNVEKSFFGRSAYRESCGEHHFKGESITPYYFKVKKVSQQVSIATLEGVIQHANKALDYGYLHLRKHLIQFCLYYPIEGLKGYSRMKCNPILFTEDPNASMAIVMYGAVRNTHLRVRKFRVGCSNDDTRAHLQKSEWHSITMGPTVTEMLSTNYDNYSYTVWWRSKYHGGGSPNNMGSSVAADALERGIRWRWTAAW